jgi:hypothetical protein
LRGRAGGQPTVPVPKKRVSRHQRDLQRQRLVRIAMAIVAGLALLLLAGGALNEYVLKPRQTLATVDGVAIRRADYWKVRAVDLLEQARQYEQFANQIGPIREASTSTRPAVVGGGAGGLGQHRCRPDDALADG